MSDRVFEPSAASYPVLCVARGLWCVSLDPASLTRLAGRLWREAAAGPSLLPGLLVAADARAHRLIRIGTSQDDRMFRSVEPAPSFRPILECDGEPFIASVQQVHEWVAIAASAFHQFESSRGFGLPADLGTAKSVHELLGRLASLPVRFRS